VNDLSRVKFVQTPVLNIGYEEHGNTSGFPIILLHGLPYDIRSWDGVVPPLVEAGHRILVPYLRGYGPTSFRDPESARMAEQAAIAQDVVDFADALGLDQFALAGFDWGNRAACITSILHPHGVRGQVAIGGYSGPEQPSRGGSQLPLLPRRDAGISGTSIPSRGGSVWKKTDEISFVIFGRPGHPGGRIQMRLSTAQPPPSIIPTSLRLSCIPIVTVT
jgi:pimeloyl-ACP methyl ester carboxylesterase